MVDLILLRLGLSIVTDDGIRTDPRSPAAQTLHSPGSQKRRKHQLFVSPARGKHHNQGLAAALGS